VITAIFTCSAVAAPVALVAAGPAFAAWGARTVLAVAAAAQTLAMILLGAGAVRAIPSDGSLRGIGMLHR
jgi:hypothetical protein